MTFALALLLQIAVYLLVFILDSYVGTLLAAIVLAIAFSIWLLSHVVEWVQPSRVSGRYYSYVLSGWLAPLTALLLYLLLAGGVDWM